MFFENVIVDGKEVPRFKEIKNVRNTKARKSNSNGNLSKWIEGIRNI